MDARETNRQCSERATHRTAGQSLVEVIIALGFGVLMIVAAVSVIAPALRMSLIAEERQTGAALGEDLLKKVTVLAEADWHNVNSLGTSSVRKYFISATSSPFAVASGTENVAISSTTYSRYFYLDEVWRNPIGNISIPDPANSIDPSTLKATVVYSRGAFTKSVVTYLVRARNKTLTQTDWSAGSCQNGPMAYANAAYASSTNILFASTTGSLVLALSGSNPISGIPTPPLILDWGREGGPSDSSDGFSGVAADGQSVYVMGIEYGAQYVERRDAATGNVISWTRFTGGDSGAWPWPGDIAIDDNNLYVVGTAGGSWRTAKYRKSDGAQLVATTSNAGSINAAFDVAIDGTYLYAVGVRDPGSGGRWYYEKRQLSDLRLMWATTSQFFGYDWANAVVVNSSSIYAVGTRNFSFGRIERRSTSTGALVAQYNTPTFQRWPYGLAIDSSALYVVGMDESATSRWFLERRSLITLSSTIYATTSFTANGNGAWATTLNSTYLYTVGAVSSSQNWGLEVRTLASGTVVVQTSTAIGDKPNAVAVYGAYLYTAGQVPSGISDWRVERRSSGVTVTCATP